MMPTNLDCVELITFSIISYLLHSTCKERKRNPFYSTAQIKTSPISMSFLATASCLFFKNFPLAFLILSSPSHKTFNLCQEFHRYTVNNCYNVIKHFMASKGLQVVLVQIPPNQYSSVSQWPHTHMHTQHTPLYTT